MTGYTYQSGIATAISTMRCPECLVVIVVERGFLPRYAPCCSRLCQKRYVQKVDALTDICMKSEGRSPRSYIKGSETLSNRVAHFASEYEVGYPRKG